MFKTLLFAMLAASSLAFGQQLMRATQSLMAGEQQLAAINPYAPPAQQDAQISGALAQIDQARAGTQQAPQP